MIEKFTRIAKSILTTFSLPLQNLTVIVSYSCCKYLQISHYTQNLYGQEVFVMSNMVLKAYNREKQTLYILKINAKVEYDNNRMVIQSMLDVIQSGYNSETRNHFKSLNRGNFMPGIIIQVIKYMRISNPKICNCKKLLPLLFLIIKGNSQCWRSQSYPKGRNCFMAVLCSQTESYGEDASTARETKRKTLVAPSHLPPSLKTEPSTDWKKKVKTQVTWEPGTQPAMISTYYRIEPTKEWI